MALFQVFTEEMIDVEKPQFRSPTHTVWFVWNVSYSGDVLNTQMSYPLHLRYHAASDSVYSATASLEPPDVLWQCTGMSPFLERMSILPTNYL